ncbi:MAG: hypothetical protein ABI548_15555 [Polyangiaceae bacterium]
MPDSVRCSVDTSQGHHTVNCEVEIGPELAASSASTVATASPPPAAAPPAPPPAASPAVAALVDRFVQSRHEVHAPTVDLVTAGSAGTCVSQIASVPLLLLGLKAPPLAVLGGLKVGYDLGACLGRASAARQLSADDAAAVKECEADGGIPTGFVEQSLMCREPAVVTP